MEDKSFSMVKQIIFISGLSGVGKSFLARKFVEKHSDFFWFDQDTIYKSEKPKVTLSNGEVVSNWDTPEALNWDEFNTFIEKLDHEKIIITGFAPLKDLIKFNISLHIDLYYTGSIEDVVQRCLKARREAKGFATEEKLKTDELMVREVTVPFYNEIMKKNIPDVMMPVFNPDGSRKDISETLERLEFWIEHMLGLKITEHVVYVAYYFSDYRKENDSEIYGVFKKKEDAIKRVRSKAFFNFGLNLNLYGEELGNGGDKDICYWLSFGKGEKNFVVTKKEVE